MNVMIELTDIEVVVLRQWRTGKNAYPRNILDKVYDALPPEPLKVGDRVTIPHESRPNLTRRIVAIHGDWAWVQHADLVPGSYMLSGLRRA